MVTAFLKLLTALPPGAPPGPPGPPPKPPGPPGPPPPVSALILLWLEDTAEFRGNLLVLKSKCFEKSVE